jgi:hypothetical protein
MPAVPIKSSQNMAWRALEDGRAKEQPYSRTVTALRKTTRRLQRSCVTLREGPFTGQECRKADIFSANLHRFFSAHRSSLLIISAFRLTPKLKIRGWAACSMPFSFSSSAANTA